MLDGADGFEPVRHGGGLQGGGGGGFAEVGGGEAEEGVHEVFVLGGC